MSSLLLAGFVSWQQLGATLLAVRGLLTAVTSLVAEQGLSSSASAVVAHRPSCPAACGSSQTRDRARAPCVGRWILNHWITREVPVGAVVNFLLPTLPVKIKSYGMTY